MSTLRRIESSDVSGTHAGVLVQPQSSAPGTALASNGGVPDKWLRAFEAQLKQFASAAASLSQLTARLSGADAPSAIQPDVELLQRMTRQGLSQQLLDSLWTTVQEMQTVVFYEKADYGGESTKLSVGKYSFEVDWQFRNDFYCSVKIPGGLSVTIFMDYMQNGGSMKLSEDTPELGKFCRKASSALIEPIDISALHDTEQALTTFCFQPPRLPPAFKRIKTPYGLQLTIFASPKAMKGRNARNQVMALRSWLELPLDPPPHVILMGDDPGVADVAKTFGVMHVPVLRTNEWGTPMLRDMFEKAEAAAPSSPVMYINADIVLPPLFADAVAAMLLAHGNKSQYMMAGQRMDMPSWIPAMECLSTDELLREAQRSARSRGSGALDYFMYPKGAWRNDFPDLILGRLAWDEWLLGFPIRQRWPVVDASFVGVVHLQHDYAHIKSVSGSVAQSAANDKWPHSSAEKAHNLRLTEGVWQSGFLHLVGTGMRIIHPQPGFGGPSLELYQKPSHEMGAENWVVKHCGVECRSSNR